MKIKFFHPGELDKNIRATVHKSGKMGFTIEAAKKMGLSPDKSMSIGMNEENSEDKNLYVLINKSKQKDSFSILKAGDYYYVNTNPLFNSLKLDYTKNSISFDIAEDEIDGMKVFVFKIKEKERIVKKN
jgi:hypothetical protein